MAEQRFCKPLSPAVKTLENKASADTTESDLARRWAPLAQTDADLAGLIDAWPNLKPEIRAALAAMAKGAAKI